MGCGEIDGGAWKDDEIYAAIVGPALRRIVAVDGVELGISGGGEAFGRHGANGQKKARDAARAGA